MWAREGVRDSPCDSCGPRATATQQTWRAKIRPIREAAYLAEPQGVESFFFAF